VVRQVGMQRADTGDGRVDVAVDAARFDEGHTELFRLAAYSSCRSYTVVA
jgi:hypothetical protein